MNNPTIQTDLAEILREIKSDQKVMLEEMRSSNKAILEEMRSSDKKILEEVRSSDKEILDEMRSSDKEILERINHLEVGQATLGEKFEAQEKILTELKGSQNKQIWALIILAFTAVVSLVIGLGKFIFFPNI